jgi:hypothetical protein
MPDYRRGIALPAIETVVWAAKTARKRFDAGHSTARGLTIYDIFKYKVRFLE